MQDLMSLTETEVANGDEAGIMLLSIRPEQLLIMLSLATRSARTSVLALDAERAYHTGQVSLTWQQLAAEGCEAWAILLEQPTFGELRSERRNGSPRQTWRRFRGQARRRFPDVQDGYLDVLTAVAIRHVEVDRVVRSATIPEGGERERG
jgi:hypothetical protein